MSWWGKVIGGTFGFLLGGPLGALLGVALGHNFDRGMERIRLSHAQPGGSERIKAAFFAATFAVMGYIAKADGRVSEDEIRMAEAVMDHMELSPDQRQAAIRLFQEGKEPGFDLDAVLGQFRDECRRRRHLLLMFLEIQLQAAYADGSLHVAEERALHHIYGRLGITGFEFRQLEGMVRAARGFAGAGAGAGPGGAGRARATPSRDRIQHAYTVLGVSPQASDAEVKRAYRRLMSQHHPDKLVAKGLPEEMMKLATEKAQEIRAAYDTVQEARKGAG
ncbi:MAG: co-chaperone DjlA [Gammaproteobacteria bacterium]